jgi:hypothetical protein
MKRLLAFIVALSCFGVAGVAFGASPDSGGDAEANRRYARPTPGVSLPTTVLLSERDAHVVPNRADQIEKNQATFIENRGQFEETVKFQMRSGWKTAWLTRSGIVIDLLRPKGSNSAAEPKAHANQPASNPKAKPPQDLERLAIAEDFVGATPADTVDGRSPLPGIYNYLTGNDRSKWRTQIKTYGEVIYRNLWKGVDVRLYGNGPNLEQEFLVAPAADASEIRVHYRGIEGLKEGNDGSLLIETAFGQWRETAPKVYQTIGGKRVAINARFKIVSETDYAFALESYDREYALVIDPTLLFSTYLGGTGDATATGIALDPAGNSYVTGYGYLGTLPTTTGVIQQNCPAPSPCSTNFIGKFSPVGVLQYLTYLGSSAGGDVSMGIAVDGNGNAFTTGLAIGSSFPTTDSAYQTACNSSYFMAKLNSTGTSLLYSTCLGTLLGMANSDGYVVPRAIALDTQGRAYIAGETLGGLPTTPGALQLSIGNGYQAAFLSVIDPSLFRAASLVYSTYLGSPDPAISSAQAIAVDGYGNAYLTGYTTSKMFPVTLNAFQPQNIQGKCGVTTPCPTAFVAKINPNVSGPTGLIYASCLGGTAGSSVYGDTGYAIAVDTSGDAYVGGLTGSPNFPTTSGAYQPAALNPGCQATGFVTKVNSYGTKPLSYSTFLEQTCGLTEIFGLALDLFGDAYVVGQTSDPNGQFPITAGAVQSVNDGQNDGFLTELSPSGSALIYSSFLGGSAYDWAAAVAVDTVGDVVITGRTTSSNFWVTPFAYESTCPTVGSCESAFVTKFPLGAPGALSITAIVPTSGGNAGTLSPQVIGTGFHQGATVTLNGPAQIPAASVVVGTEGQTIGTTFDLTGAPPGAYNVVVTNPDNTVATLSNAFTVQQGGTPKVLINLSGLVRRTAPYEQTAAATNASYIVSLSNIGNIDTAGFVSLAVDSIFAVTSANPATVAGASPTDSYYDIIWSDHLLSAGIPQAYTANATSPAASGSTTASACFLPYTNVNDAGFLSAIANNSSLRGIAACSDAVLACSSDAATVSGLESCLTGLMSCSSQAGPIVLQTLKDNTSLLPPEVCTSTTFPISVPQDPNSLSGSAGSGAAKWVAASQPLDYIVSFSNEPTAMAAAQQVVVTQPLGTSVNLATLSLLGINIPNGVDASGVQVRIPPGSFSPAIGLNEFQTSVDLRPAQSLMVIVDVTLDPVARTLTWLFQAIDPASGAPPDDTFVGVLPKGAGAAVSFAVTPVSGLATGTQISDQAAVVFDGLPPTNTKVWSNTLDNTPPSSRVQALPTHSCVNFKVAWPGSDIGAGIQDYTVYVSDNGGPFSPWQTNNPATSGTYQGQGGHSYGFYSIARDRTGNLEPAKMVAEATTSVAKTTTCGGPPSLNGGTTVLSLSGTTLTVALQVTNNGTEDADNIVMNKIVSQVVSGSGKVILTSPALPLALGNLAAGASTTVNLVLTVPKTAINVAISESGTVQDASGKTYAYTLGQEVVP